MIAPQAKNTVGLITAKIGYNRIRRRLGVRTYGQKRKFKTSVEKYSGVKLNSKNGNLLFFVILPILAIGIIEKYWIQISICTIFGLTAYLYEKNSWRRTVSKSGIDDIDKMPDGRDFEKRLQVLFEDLGYRATLTPHNDYGCDVVVNNYKGMKTAVQTKLRGGGQPAVGVSAVQEVTTSMPVYNAIHGIVVTNRDFTPQARTLAQKNRVELWNREILIRKLAEARIKPIGEPIFQEHQTSNFLINQMMVPVPDMEVAEEFNPDNNDEFIPF